MKYGVIRHRLSRASVTMLGAGILLVAGGCAGTRHDAAVSLDELRSDDVRIRLTTGSWRDTRILDTSDVALVVQDQPHASVDTLMLEAVRAVYVQGEGRQRQVLCSVDFSGSLWVPTSRRARQIATVNASGGTNLPWLAVRLVRS
jgi:hypothetical protein